MEFLGCLGAAEAAPELPPLDIGALSLVLKSPQYPCQGRGYNDTISDEEWVRIFWPHDVLDEWEMWPTDTLLDLIPPPKGMSYGIDTDYFGALQEH